MQQHETGEQIKDGLTDSLTSPTKGEETSTIHSTLMEIVLERIESGELDLRQTVQRFHDFLPQETQSWIAAGENEQIAPEDIVRILGPNDLSAIAEEAGMPQAEVAVELTAVLPHVIDKFTPEGWLPDTETTRKAAGDLKSKLG